MTNIFTIVADLSDKVVIKVNIDNNLTIALNPFLDGQMDYISVTKGQNHILTIIKKDGATERISWEEYEEGYISNIHRMLKTNVINYLVSKGIMLNVVTEEKLPNEISICYNINFHCWQINYNFGVNNVERVWIKECDMPNERNMKMALEIVNKRYKVKIISIKRGTCPTNIPIWYATEVGYVK